MNFNGYMDGVVMAAVQLVNALTPGEARGHPYRPPAGPGLAGAAAGALRAAGQTGVSALSVADAGELSGFARELRAVFEHLASGDVDAAAHQVNLLLAATDARPWLDRHDGQPWHLHFHGPKDSPATGWAARCATGLAVVLGNGLHGRLGVCTAPRCDRVYVDTSRNGTRRFCSTSCQNRVKTAAFRARTA
ncbi:MAG: CGNR zinc finger domain-containing protein [Nocardiopsaceae bacterium]|nr:CGNR zinc finger domain-containing protein [Nocardiopsaceae bacterium]